VPPASCRTDDWLPGCDPDQATIHDQPVVHPLAQNAGIGSINATRRRGHQRQLGGGIYGLPAMSLYSASKFALEGLSEAVSYELASQDIVVKLIESHGGVTLRTSIRVLDRIL